MKKRFITIFPMGQNIHLIKDVGMVPYVLQKERLYETTVAFYEEKSKLPYLDSEVQGLKYEQIKKVFSKEEWNTLFFLFANFRKYDVVMFFHFNIHRVIIALIIKILSLGRVKFYIKSDSNIHIYEAGLNKKTLKNRIYQLLMKNIDLFTAETTEINDYLNNETFIKSKYLPNGFVGNSLMDIEKEKTILIVARIGDPVKDHPTLLRALEGVELKDWSVKIIGPIEKDFEKSIEAFYDNNPDKKGCVVFTGNISDRKKIEEEYIKAKVFVLTSISEGFPLVFTEALSKGNYIVSTDLPSARDITANGKYGKLFPVGDSNRLRSILQDIVDEKEQLPETKEIVSFANENFDWSVLVHRLYHYLEK